MVNVTPRLLYPHERPLYKRPGGPQSLVWTGAENLASTGIRSTDRPACSDSLYRLNHPGQRINACSINYECCRVFCYFTFVMLRYVQHLVQLECASDISIRRRRGVASYIWSLLYGFLYRMLREGVFYILCNLHWRWGHAVAQLLRHYATNRKVAGSIPDGKVYPKTGHEGPEGE
jgi:hypothetical protein